MKIKRIILTTCAVAGMSVATLAGAQGDERVLSFSDLDVDSDLRISATEARADAVVGAQFVERDTNQDGYLDAQEFALIDRSDKDYQ
ncbi:MAG: hypothetical protein AAF004_03040 [Pseudomonadota bacterium]